MRCAMLTILAAAAMSCGTVGVLDNEDQKLLPLARRVAERHDRLANKLLTGPELTTALADSAAFLSVFEPEEIPVRPVYELVLRVLKRHEDLVQNPQSGLSQDMIGLAMTSSENIRRTFTAARNPVIDPPNSGSPR